MLTFSSKEMPMFKSVSALFLFCVATATPTFAALPAPVVDTIDGRRVESLTLRHPTSEDVVVFEGGSRSTIDKWGTVPEQIAMEASVFAYNRPGYGNSEVAATPRDGRTIVEELRAILRHKGLKPPYVLVGHSLGGLYMQLFARTYPDEVKALVLVDSLYPRMIKKTQDFPLMTRIAGQLAFSRSVWREIEKIDETGDMVLGLAGIDDKPIVRLVNQPTSSTAIAVDFGAFRMDNATRDAVRALYPKAKTVVADSSHQMALTSPEIVTAAIRHVLPSLREKAFVGQ
jgi:pimeloyl-ACP methyl ester carboxylesterase